MKMTGDIHKEIILNLVQFHIVNEIELKMT